MKERRARGLSSARGARAGDRPASATGHPHHFPIAKASSDPFPRELHGTDRTPRTAGRRVVVAFEGVEAEPGIYVSETLGARMTTALT